MNLTPMDALGLHETLMVVGQNIEKLAFFQTVTQNTNLDRILVSHERKYVQIYEELEHFADSAANVGAGIGAGMGATVGGAYAGNVAGNINIRHGATGFNPARRGMLQGAGAVGNQALQPQTTGQLTDRVIAGDCMVSCKSLAVQTIWTATELSSSPLRRSLADASRNFLDMAFELYQFQQANGWYPAFNVNDNPQQWLGQAYGNVQYQGNRQQTYLS